MTSKNAAQAKSTSEKKNADLALKAELDCRDPDQRNALRKARHEAICAEVRAELGRGAKAAEVADAERAAVAKSDADFAELKKAS